MMAALMGGAGDDDNATPPQWVCSELAGILELDFTALAAPYAGLDVSVAVGRSFGTGQAAPPDEVLLNTTTELADAGGYNTAQTFYQASQYTWFFATYPDGLYTEAQLLALGSIWETFAVQDPGCGEAAGGGGGGGGGGGSEGGTELM